MKILVISPHPDDETLGAGGVILKAKYLGHQAFWLNLTNMKEEYGYSNLQVSTRLKEINLINKLFQFDGYFDLGLQPTKLDQYAIGDIIEKIGKVFKEISPNIVFVPYWKDVHSDHQVAFNAAYSCTKSFRYPTINAVLSMEILSETDNAQAELGFIPNFFIGIDDYIEEKVAAINIYKSEVALPPFPRSAERIRALAMFRGGCCGYKFAEAFRIEKCIF